MAVLAANSGSLGDAVAAKALTVSAMLWFAAAMIGQWAFVYYIAASYGASTFSGNLAVWNRLEALGRTPYVAGDTTENLAYAAHALGAGIIAFGGALQLVPHLGALTLVMAGIFAFAIFSQAQIKGAPLGQPR
jgi:hypothetical protein